MPKAMLITVNNLQHVSELSKWNLTEDDSLAGYYYVEDVQFPHGYVEQAIVTQDTFEATFKSDMYVGPSELVSVDYK